MLNIKTFSYENDEHLFGPGKRLLIFCQGCTLRCPGCINQHLWEFGTGQDISPEEVLQLCKEVDGVTLHGGEPLDQSESLLDVVKLLKNNDKTVILFTGYKLKELTKREQKEIWKLADIVVSGRYIEKKRNIYLQFRGSTNQRVYCHKGKCKHYKIKDGKSVAIFRLNEDGNVVARGFRNTELDILFRDIHIKNKK